MGSIVAAMGSANVDPELAYFFATQDHTVTREELEEDSRRRKMLKAITTLVISTALVGAMLLSAANSLFLV